MTSEQKSFYSFPKYGVAVDTVDEDRPSSKEVRVLDNGERELVREWKTFNGAIAEIKRRWKMATEGFFSNVGTIETYRQKALDSSGEAKGRAYRIIYVSGIANVSGYKGGDQEEIRDLFSGIVMRVLQEENFIEEDH